MTELAQPFIPVPVEWYLLQPGDFIDWPDDMGLIHTWKIEAKKSGDGGIWTLLVDAFGNKLAVPPPMANTVATVVWTARDLNEPEQLKIVKRELGAEVVAIHVPPFQGGKGNLPPARAHLWLMHGIYTDDVKRFEKLLEFHDEAHAEHGDHGPGWRPHVHDYKGYPAYQ